MVAGEFNPSHERRGYSAEACCIRRLPNRKAAHGSRPVLWPHVRGLKAPHGSHRAEKTMHIRK